MACSVNCRIGEESNHVVPSLFELQIVNDCWVEIPKPVAHLLLADLSETYSVISKEKIFLTDFDSVGGRELTRAMIEKINEGIHALPAPEKSDSFEVSFLST